MITITFEEIEQRYKRIHFSANQLGSENEELNLLIRELQNSYLIPLMLSEIKDDFRRTKEFQMYIKLSKLRTIYLENRYSIDD